MGSFIHLLERQVPALSETFGRIAADPSHTSPAKLSDWTVGQRSFPDLQMGYRAIGEKDLAKNQDLFAREEGRWVVITDANLDNRLRVIFDAFFKINGGVRS